MLKYVEETCIKILESYANSRVEIATQIVEFCFPPAGQSTRSVDVVPSIKVLVMQFYAMTKIKNLEVLFKDEPLLQEHFCSEQGLAKMKQVLIRYSVEEALRRSARDAEQVVESENLLSTLFEGHLQFYNPLIAARE